MPDPEDLTPEQRLDSLQARLEQQEIKLLESEHRWPQIISNFIEFRSRPEDDSKRKASARAIFWRVFAPATIALGLGGGGLVAAVWTGVLFHRQNELVSEQNSKFDDQNTKFDTQNTEFKTQNGLVADSNKIIQDQIDALSTQFEKEEAARNLRRKTELIGVLWDTKEVPVEVPSRAAAGVPAEDSDANSVEPHVRTVPLASARHRREASIEYAKVLATLDEKVDLVGARLDGITASDSWCETARQGAFLGSSLIGVDLERATLSGADLGGADLSGADLIRADLTKADLIMVNLSGADLSFADLTWANSFGSNLAGANLDTADLTWANLMRANLAGANFAEASLLGADLSRARWTDSTIWPSKFAPPEDSFFLDGEGNKAPHPEWVVKLRAEQAQAALEGDPPPSDED